MNNISVKLYNCNKVHKMNNKEVIEKIKESVKNNNIFVLRGVAVEYIPDDQYDSIQINSQATDEDQYCSEICTGIAECMLSLIHNTEPTKDQSDALIKYHLKFIEKRDKLDVYLYTDIINDSYMDKIRKLVAGNLPSDFVACDAIDYCAYKVFVGAYKKYELTKSKTLEQISHNICEYMKRNSRRNAVGSYYIEFVQSKNDCIVIYLHCDCDCIAGTLSREEDYEYKKVLSHIRQHVDDYVTHVLQMEYKQECHSVGRCDNFIYSLRSNSVGLTDLRFICESIGGLLLLKKVDLTYYIRLLKYKDKVCVFLNV